MVAERCFFFGHSAQPVAGLSGQKSVRNILQSFQQDIHSAPQSTLDMNTKTPAITSTILIVCIYLLPPNDLSDCLGLHLSKKYDRLSVCLLPPWHYCVCFIFGESEERMRADKRMLHAGNGVIQASQMSSSWWQPKQNNSVIQGTSGRHGEDPQVPNTFAIYEEDNATKRFQVIY